MAVTPKQKKNLRRGNPRNSGGRPRKDPSAAGAWDAVRKKLMGPIEWLAAHNAAEIARFKRELKDFQAKKTGARKPVPPVIDWPLHLKAVEVATKNSEALNAQRNPGTLPPMPAAMEKLTFEQAEAEVLKRKAEREKDE